MRRISRMGIGVQMFEAAPVLHYTNTAPVYEILRMQQAQRRIASQFLNHRRHGGRNPCPAPQREEPVDPHADEENHKRLRTLRGVAAREDRSHTILLIAAVSVPA